MRNYRKKNFWKFYFMELKTSLPSWILKLAVYLFPSFFSLSLTNYLVFDIFICILLLCSIYVQNLQQEVYVFYKFCVLCCIVLFTFIFNIFVTNESMYIVMTIEKKELLSMNCLKRERMITINNSYREFLRFFLIHQFINKMTYSP